MDLEKGYIYHIYNQGNNKQRIFFEQENYLFFLKKIKTYVLPYTDILAWCLMPNHFHLMVLVNEVELKNASDTMTSSHRITKTTTLNNSIAIMLRSYTRAINKQEKRSGSLFKAHTKSECVNYPKGVSPAWFKNNGITQINITNPEKQYPQICFEYIHQNPVKAGLVKRAEDWEFSSARDYFGNRSGRLINIKKAREYLITDMMT